MGNYTLLRQKNSERYVKNMTSKDLKKLSRLEILEILLEESKENERLRAEIDALREKSSVRYSENKLYELTKQMNSTLLNTNKLISDLQKITKEGLAAKSTPVYAPPPKQDLSAYHIPDEPAGKPISDKALYCRLMKYYSQNEAAVSFLPADIQNDVRARLRGILNAKK